MNKVAQLKVKDLPGDPKTPIYYVICEGNRNPIGQTYNIESARIIRDQLEDLWIEYWNDEFKNKPLTTRYSISVS